jgi:hypothetical protein
MSLPDGWAVGVVGVVDVVADLFPDGWVGMVAGVVASVVVSMVAMVGPIDRHDLTGSSIV